MIRAALKYNRGRRRADVRPVPGQSCLWGLGRSAEGANHAGAVVAWREVVLLSSFLASQSVKREECVCVCGVDSAHHPRWMDLGRPVTARRWANRMHSCDA